MIGTTSDHGGLISLQSSTSLSSCICYSDASYMDGTDSGLGIFVSNHDDHIPLSVHLFKLKLMRLLLPLIRKLLAFYLACILLPFFSLSIALFGRTIFQ
uniref:Uncharacterized protein n=1 Tax=Arundo donax TaxID=35708 RepID=A0A0A9ESW4_ARUDO